jgi:sigma-E factor negative regulatory protein RseC
MSGVMIKHQAEVVCVEGDIVRVRMTVNSACGGCSARSACGVSESSDKIVEVRTAQAAEFSVGESVEVALASRSMGMQSVLWAYVMPFVVMCIALVLSRVAGINDGLAVLVTLASVAIYYLALFAMRNKLEKTINFIILKQTK